MNILSQVDPIVMNLTLPWPAEIRLVQVTIKPGYEDKVCMFSFDVTLETENPADMGGYVGLESTDYLPA